jgi:hypothetical protein
MNTILNHDIKIAYENYRSVTNTEMKKLQEWLWTIPPCAVRYEVSLKCIERFLCALIETMEIS